MFKTLFKLPKKTAFLIKFIRFTPDSQRNLFRFSSANNHNFKNESSNLESSRKIFEIDILDQMGKHISNLPLIEENLKTADLCSTPILSSTKVLPNVKNKIQEANVFVTTQKKGVYLEYDRYFEAFNIK